MRSQPKDAVARFEMRLSAVEQQAAALRFELVEMQRPIESEAPVWLTVAEVRSLKAVAMQNVLAAVAQNELPSQFRLDHKGRMTRVVRADHAKAWNPRGAR